MKIFFFVSICLLFNKGAFTQLRTLAAVDSLYGKRAIVFTSGHFFEVDSCGNVNNNFQVYRHIMPVHSCFSISAFDLWRDRSSGMIKEDFINIKWLTK